METLLTVQNGIYAALFLVAIVASLTRQRYLRPVLLLVSLVVIGFLQMGCPSPSGALQGMLYYWGEWKRAVPFTITVLIVLVPTFFFGKVFCGWVCHKGAVQEFLFQKRIAITVPWYGNGYSFLFQKRIAITVPGYLDKPLRMVKYLILAAVIVAPLLFHYRLLNSSTQPFKVLFNLGGPISAVIVMSVLAISSLFIYRPFCRYFCPIGALLGLAAKVGLYHMKVNDSSCVACGRCEKTCDIAAIARDNNKRVKINKGECIACGECKDVCTKKSIIG